MFVPEIYSRSPGYNLSSLSVPRKNCLLLNNTFLMAAALLALSSRAAKSFEMIIMSRILVGINAGVLRAELHWYTLSTESKLPRCLNVTGRCFAGISMNVQPMYFGECAPRQLRGAISLSSCVFTAFGVVLGQVVGLRYGLVRKRFHGFHGNDPGSFIHREILGSEQCWQYLLASNAIPGIIQLLTLPWFPESPRYLLIDRGDKEGCINGGYWDMSAWFIHAGSRQFHDVSEESAFNCTEAFVNKALMLWPFCG